MKYHVHVYQVVGQQEFDLEAESEEAARATALKRAAKRGVWLRADCNALAIIPAES